MRLVPRILTIAIAALLAIDGCASPRKPLGAGGPIVRVQLIGAASQVTLQFTAPPKIRATTGAGSVPSLAANTPIGITLAPDGWHVGGATAGGGDLLISSVVGGSVSIDGKPYRGSFRLIATGGGTFDVINDVDIESYLKGVLAAEMLAKWDIEAYKAQAVAARTYVLFEKINPQGKTFDVFDDTRSQVYKGISVETEKSQLAVDETRGVVVAYAPPGKEPRIFKAYFSACCGGIASNVTDVFNGAYIPPLGDRNMGSTCAQSPRFNWGPVTLTKDELTRRIRLWGVKRNNMVRECARIESIEPAAANTFGRPTTYVLTDAKGARFILPAEGMRQATNTDGTKATYVYSGFMKAVADQDSFTLTGHGSGHGVGLCQYCCQYQALAGLGYEKILALNYPQSVRVRAY